MVGGADHGIHSSPFSEAPHLHSGASHRSTQLRNICIHGYLHCGGPGAGHFVKMVHNGVEYGIEQLLSRSALTSRMS